LELGAVIENDEFSLRLLVVENEAVIAVLLHGALRNAGLVVVGPAFNLWQAEQLASNCDIDGALLDVYLDNGESTLSVARILQQRRIPFMFVTGGSFEGIPGMEGVPVLRKPVSAAEIITAARSFIGQQSSSASPVICTPAASEEHLAKRVQAV
jgi:DNA-binding response OmpR family regulator